MQSKIYLLILYATNWLATADNNNIKRHGQELLLCRQCGADVADSYYIFSKISPGARKTEKQNLFGRQNLTVQTLINPFGVKFDIVTAEKARCANVGPVKNGDTDSIWTPDSRFCYSIKSHGADSWFPGYKWRLCTCPHCGQHIGWTFHSSPELKPANGENDNVDSFHGIILKNVLGENFTDSLIMMPKLYKM